MRRKRRPSGPRSAPFSRCSAQGSRIVWRLCPTPSHAPTVAPFAALHTGFGGILLRLGRRADLVEPRSRRSGAGRRRRHRSSRGQIGGRPRTLVMASEAVRASVPVFEPLSAGLAQLTARVKRGFDPRGVLNPGRMQEGLLMQTNFTAAQLADPDTACPKRSCAPACIAASARRPARPMCCSATSSTARGGASTSSRTCWRTIARPRPRWSSISTGASPASPA